jgi:hypothetical protein
VKDLIVFVERRFVFIHHCQAPPSLTGPFFKFAIPKFEILKFFVPTPTRRGLTAAIVKDLTVFVERRP